MALNAGRTLSSRILAGFAMLIVGFTATMVWIVLYMNDMQREIAVIRTRYIRLTIVAKDLAGQQQVLASYLKEEMPGESNAQLVQRRLERLRGRRQELLAQLTSTMESLRGQPRGHGQAAIRNLDKVSGVERSIAALDAQYTTMLAAPPIERTLHADPPTVDPATLSEALRARDALVQAEGRLVIALADLADSLRLKTEQIANNLEYNAARLRLFTVVMGAIAVGFGLLVTAWVTLSLRPLGRLRAAAGRIAAGDYGSRIDERGPAEVADLAREFNAMGRAVEEREREVVRAERLAAVGKMAAMITHEVRNPLSSIGLNAELLEDELDALDAGPEARDLCQLDPSLYNAALDLGCTPRQAFTKVIMPQLSPAILSAFLICLTYSIDDFMISYFNSGTMQTLPIAIYSMTRKKVSPEINALSAVIFCVILAIILISNAADSRAYRRNQKAIRKAMLDEGGR